MASLHDVLLRQKIQFRFKSKKCSYTDRHIYTYINATRIRTVDNTVGTAELFTPVAFELHRLKTLQEQIRDSVGLFYR